MKRFYAVVTTLVLSASISGVVMAGNPCMPIAQACMQEGYVKGGNQTGKGLIEDCVKPVVEHQKTLPNSSFSDDQLSQCKSMMEQKMQQQQQSQQPPQQ